MKGHNYGLCKKCGVIHKRPFKGKRHTEESKQKNRLAHLGKSTWNKGLTKETNESVRQTALKLKRHVRTDTHRKNISKARKEWFTRNIHPLKGKRRKESVKEKIRQTVKNTMKDPEIRKKCRLGRLNQILPKEGTFIENLMQSELTKRKTPFKRQVSLLEKYQVDFLIREKLVVECDGRYWHNYPYGLEKDRRRDKELRNSGFVVLRFWGTDIKNNISHCVDEIEAIFEGEICLP